MYSAYKLNKQGDNIQPWLLFLFGTSLLFYSQEGWLIWWKSPGLSSQRWTWLYALYLPPSSHQFSSVQFSRSVVSDSLRPHESTHSVTIFNVKKTEIMPLGPITSWQIEGEKVEAGADFLFLSSRITADGDCSHEIRRQLLLGRKAMTKLDGALKS